MATRIVGHPDDAREQEQPHRLPKGFLPKTADEWWQRVGGRPAAPTATETPAFGVEDDRGHLVRSADETKQLADMAALGLTMATGRTHKSVEVYVVRASAHRPLVPIVGTAS